MCECGDCKEAKLEQRNRKLGHYNAVLIDENNKLEDRLRRAIRERQEVQRQLDEYRSIYRKVQIEEDSNILQVIGWCITLVLLIGIMWRVW